MADRKYYSETVGHFIRFYLKYPSLTTFTSPVDEKFYKIVSKHCKSLSADEYRIVDICYQPKTKMPEQVKKAVLRAIDEIKKSQSKEETATINYEDALISIKQKLQEQFNVMDLALSKIEYQKLKLETLDSKIKQQEQLFNSGYGSEKDLLQAKIDRTTAEIELVQNKLSLAGACSTAAFICGENLF